MSLTIEQNVLSDEQVAFYHENSSVSQPELEPGRDPAGDQ